MLACTEPAVFACWGDSDCVLGGDQGQCQDNGSCAYPDDDCTSGLSYPEGAPPDLAGRCVPDDGSDGTGTGGTDTGAVASSSGDESSSTGASTSGADEGTSSESGSSGAVDSSGGETGSSGGAACNVDEIGDTPEDAFELGTCAGKYTGLLQDPMDGDWFSLGECSGGVASLEISVDEPDSSLVCLVPFCEQGDLPTLDCGDGIELPDMNGQTQGCCGASAFEAGYDCQGQLIAVYVVAASALPEAPECTGYAFTVLAQ